MTLKLDPNSNYNPDSMLSFNYSLNIKSDPNSNFNTYYTKNQ
jgi:hypothetical protein